MQVKKSRYDQRYILDPGVPETLEFEGYDDYEIVLLEIAKKGKVYLDVEATQLDPLKPFSFRPTYPSAKGKIYFVIIKYLSDGVILVSDLSKLILHGPLEVHGYEQGSDQFSLFCIYNEELATSMQWFLGEKHIGSGLNHQKIISNDGTYRVIVRRWKQSGNCTSGSKARKE